MAARLSPFPAEKEHQARGNEKAHVRESEEEHAPGRACVVEIEERDADYGNGVQSRRGRGPAMPVGPAFVAVCGHVEWLEGAPALRADRVPQPAQRVAAVQANCLFRKLRS